MIIDTFTNSQSLAPIPEEYRFTLQLQPEEIIFFKSLKEIVQGLLCSTIQNDMSIYDFFEFRKKIKAIGFDQYISLTPKALAVLKNHLETVKLIGAIQRGDWNDKIPDGLLKTVLGKDQKAAIAYHLAQERSGNWFAVGLGKTFISLYWFAILLNRSRAKRLLVICLNENKSTWKKQIIKHTDWIDYTHIVRNGTNAVLRDIDDFAASDKKILIVHYEALAGTPGQPAGKSQIVQNLSALNLDAIVCDEAHTLQNMESKRTECVMNIFANIDPRFALFLTATPVNKTPLNAYPILKLIRPIILPAKARFDNHFTNQYLLEVTRKDKKTGKKVKTGRRVKVLDNRKPYKNLSELSEMMKLYGIRRTHDEIAGMPETIDQIVQLSLDGQQLDLYNKIVTETYNQVAAVPSKAVNLDVAMVKTLRLRQLLSNPAILGENVESCKILSLDNIVEQHMADPANKMLIWSCFKPNCDFLADRYKDYGAVPFHGDVEKRRFADYETAFMESDEPRILCCTPDKAGTGKNLHRARLDVWVDRPIRPLHYKQARGRIERRDAIGSSVHVILTVPGSVDDWVTQILDSRIKMSTELIGDDLTQTHIQKADLLTFLKPLVKP